MHFTTKIISIMVTVTIIMATITNLFKIAVAHVTVISQEIAYRNFVGAPTTFRGVGLYAEDYLQNLPVVKA